ncbi:MAG: hypothetical protein JWN39_1959, partial [Ilumatobacteraceae bacterium]|nr:hypothetical protein [Ilumatobacteraceae bacterium]
MLIAVCSVAFVGPAHRVGAVMPETSSSGVIVESSPGSALTNRSLVEAPAPAENLPVSAGVGEFSPTVCSTGVGPDGLIGTADDTYAGGTNAATSDPSTGGACWLTAGPPVPAAPEQQSSPPVPGAEGAAAVPGLVELSGDVTRPLAAPVVKVERSSAVVHLGRQLVATVASGTGAADAWLPIVLGVAAMLSVPLSL